MKNKVLYTILFSLLLAFLFMPIIQEHLGIFNIKPLTGVIHKPKDLNLHIRTIQKGNIRHNWKDTPQKIMVSGNLSFVCIINTYGHVLKNLTIGM